MSRNTALRQYYCSVELAVARTFKTANYHIHLCQFHMWAFCIVLRSPLVNLKAKRFPNCTAVTDTVMDKLDNWRICHNEKKKKRFLTSKFIWASQNCIYCLRISFRVPRSVLKTKHVHFFTSNNKSRLQIICEHGHTQGNTSTLGVGSNPCPNTAGESPSVLRHGRAFRWIDILS